MEAVCRELMAREGRVTVRRLQAELLARLGAKGRGQRVLALCRRLGAAAESVPADVGGVSAASVRGWAARVEAAERRAALAEAREQQHQDRWANDVYALKQQLEQLKQRVHVTTAVHQRYIDALVVINQLQAQLAARA
jgi:RecA/RadA recombinase